MPSTNSSQIFLNSVEIYCKNISKHYVKCTKYKAYSFLSSVSVSKEKF